MPLRSRAPDRVDGFYTCTVEGCAAVFSTIAALKQHLRAVIPCFRPHCSLIFHLPDDLDEHIRISKSRMRILKKQGSDTIAGDTAITEAMIPKLQALFKRQMIAKKSDPFTTPVRDSGNAPPEVAIKLLAASLKTCCRSLRTLAYAMLLVIQSMRAHKRRAGR
ncbi:hypothetical protein HK097_002615 [Rhizophlyctis rosea]|uniref:C2H2-type domain-containing protein n=1 Tax=Rhizophlyctis rosea TaxID=64517 RepID=A0AAD5S460_9FUNG|nr:hypothetical protein HK097_002615 [Rhizophlyctis rosea]